MTISSSTRKFSYTGNGVTTAFSFPRLFFSNSDLGVLLDGVLQVSGYTITGAGSPSGGTVTFNSAPDVDVVVTIYREVDYIQETDFVENDPSSAETTEEALDLLTMMSQQLAEESERTIKAPITDTTPEMELPDADSRANKALIFDADGDVTVSTDDYEDQLADVTAQADAAAASAAAAAASASAAASSASSASSSASTATTAASSASTSATSASTSATTASTAATNASNSASSASTSASTATTQATNAANSASSASTSATNAATSETNAATSASSASTSASSASTSASSASTSASSASSSASAAAASAASVAATLASALWRDVHRLTSADSPYTVVSGDNGKLLICDTSSGAITVNMPQISGLTLPFNIGVQLDAGSNTVTIARGGTDTLDGGTSLSIGTSGAGYELIADSTPSPDEWEVIAFGVSTGNFTVDTFSGTGAQTAFTLSVDPGSENNTFVSISGVYQQKNSYSVSGTTLTFGVAPASGTNNIEVISGSSVSIGTPSDATVTSAKLAQTVISGLSAETAVDTADELMLSDTSAGTVDKTTVNNLFKAVNTFTAMTDVDTADNIHVYDTSGSASKKATLQEVFEVINTFTEDTSPDTSADFLLSYDTSASTVKKVKPVNAAPAAGMTVIDSGNLSNGSRHTVDIVVPATYRGLVLYINGASNSVATRALVVKPDAGGGLGTDVTIYTQTANTTTTVVSGNAQLWTPVTQTAAQTTSCVIYFDAYQSGPIKTYRGFAEPATTAGSEWGTSSSQTIFSGAITNGNTAKTGALVGIRITWDNVATGIMDGGTYALYGIN